MSKLLKSIEAEPLSYLPEQSLPVLWSFLKGYYGRCQMEGQYQDFGTTFREFDNWIKARFQVKAKALNFIDVICSFCETEQAALLEYFRLLREFEVTHKTTTRVAECPPTNRLDLIEVIKLLRKDPLGYLGSTSFRACYSFLMGDERACIDLSLPKTDDRILFNDFKGWVERNKNRALPRPWFKIISFWSGLEDCGHTSRGAFSLFYTWLDQYAKEIDKPNLFG